MGQEMCSVTNTPPEACQNTLHLNLQHCRRDAPPCGPSEDRLQTSLFLSVGGVIVQISRLGLEVMAVFHDIVGQVTTERRVTLGTKDNPSGIANPSVGPWCELKH